VQSRIGVSVLCPGWVKTHILEADRNRPESLQNEIDPAQTADNGAMVKAAGMMRQAVEAELPTHELAEQVFSAIEEEKFDILVNATDFLPAIQTRFENILQGRNPA